MHQDARSCVSKDILPQRDTRFIGSMQDWETLHFPAGAIFTGLGLGGRLLGAARAMADVAWHRMLVKIKPLEHMLSCGRCTILQPRGES